MLKKIALALLAGVALLAVVIALQPASFVVERSAAIEAPPALLYAHIANLRALDAWMPWSKLDPERKTAYQGAEAGVGARSSWEGPQMGKGRLTITAVEPERSVEMQLEMLEPMAATNRVRFTLVPAGKATTVTWHMEGRNGFAGKALALFADMDAMVGEPFERGLADLAETVRVEQAQRAAAD